MATTFAVFILSPFNVGIPLIEQISYVINHFHHRNDIMKINHNITSTNIKIKQMIYGNADKSALDVDVDIDMQKMLQLTQKMMQLMLTN